MTCRSRNFEYTSFRSDQGQKRGYWLFNNRKFQGKGHSSHLVLTKTRLKVEPMAIKDYMVVEMIKEGQTIFVAPSNTGHPVSMNAGPGPLT